MAYKYSKGITYQGDIYDENDAQRNTYIDFGADDYIGLVTSGSSVLVVSGSKVGIGTATPDYTLDVAGNAGFDEYIYHNGDADTYILFEDDTLTFAAGGRSFLKLEEASQDKLIINHGGLNIDLKVSGQNEPNLIRTDAANDKVGIGVGEPDHTLTVAGDITASVNISASAFYGDGSKLQGVTGSGGGGSTSPGGSNTQVQFNNSDSFDGDSNFTWNDTTAELAVASISSSTYISASTVDIYTAIHFSQSATQTSDFTVAQPGIPCYRVDTSSGVVTASLPTLAAGMEGRWVNIKDTGLSASANNVVVKPNGSDTIDGATSLKIQANGGSVGLQADPDAAEWYIIFTN